MPRLHFASRLCLRELCDVVAKTAAWRGPLKKAAKTTLFFVLVVAIENTGGVIFYSYVKEIQMLQSLVVLLLPC